MKLQLTPSYGPRVKLCGCAVSVPLRKAKRKVTGVGRYVERKQAALTQRLAATMREWARKSAKSVRNKLGKADQDIVDRALKSIDTEGFSIDLVDELTPSLRAAFQRAGITGLAQVNMSATADATRHLDIKAREYAEQRGGELIKELGDTTEEHLRSLLSRGVEEGMSADKLADELEDAAAFGEARAEMIARTELAFAHVQGNVEGWRQSGEVTGKRSILGDLHDISDECDDCQDAGVVGIDEDFVPGFAWPPYHPRCECDVLPILSGEEDDPESQD